MSESETEEDIGNVEAWAEVLKHILCRVPSGKRTTVLMLALQNEEAERQNREANGGRFTKLDLQDWNQSAACRHYFSIVRLKSLIIQVFARQINNNHSKEEAKQILYVHHNYGTGSRWLGDYV